MKELSVAHLGNRKVGWSKGLKPLRHYVGTILIYTIDCDEADFFNFRFFLSLVTITVRQALPLVIADGRRLRKVF